MKKRFVSLLVVVALMVCLSAPAFASEAFEAEVVVSRSEMVLEEREDYVLSVVGEDLSNGNVRFSMVENGQVISSSYVDRSTEKIIYTKHENGLEVFCEEKEARVISHELVASSVARASNNFISVGRVGYNHYIQGMNSGVNYIY